MGNSILYRTVVIHQLEDFGRSPIGPRIACGIIWPEMKSRPPKPPTTPTPPTTPAPTPVTTPAAPMYQEMSNTWLSAPPAKDDDQCKFIDTGNTLGTGKGMHMPGGGSLEGCKEMCNGNQDCHAIEYAPSPGEGAQDCCILVNCTGGSVPTPMETGDFYHDVNLGYMYKGYKKVMSDMNGYGSSSMMPGSSSMMPMMSTSADQPAKK